MSLERRIAVGVLASYASRAAQIILSFTLIPLLFRYLSQEEIGIWFVIGQSSLFLGLMDFGFGPTLVRRIAFAKGASGHDVDVELSEESRRQISALVGTGRILYRYVAVLVVVAAGGTGAMFLGTLELTRLSLSQVMIAWALVCVSYAINTWGSFWFNLLSGLGYVGGAGFIGLGFQVFGLLIKIAVVLLGGGLVELALSECVIGLASRQVTLIYLRHRVPDLSQLLGGWSSDDFRSMLSPAIRCWLTSLGAFLILRTDQFFIARFEGAAALPNYQAAYAVVSSLYTFALAFSSTSNVFYSQLWQAGEFGALHNLVQRNLRLALGMMICGCAGIILSSPALFDLWLGPGHFVGYPILLAFAVTLILEAQHVVFAYASRSTEDEAFAGWAMGAGILNLVFTWSLIGQYGLLGVALGTCFAQLLTNNWYVIYRAHRRLRLSLRQYVRESVLPAIGLAAVAVAPLATLWWQGWLPTEGWPRILCVNLWCGMALAAYLWHYALSSDERRRLKLRASGALPYRWRPA